MNNDNNDNNNNNNDHKGEMICNIIKKNKKIISYQYTIKQLIIIRYYIVILFYSRKK